MGAKYKRSNVKTVNLNPGVVGFMEDMLRFLELIYRNG